MYVEIWETLIEVQPDLSIEPCNDVINSLSDILRYIMFSGDERVDDKSYEMFTEETFTVNFIYVAGHSLQSGRSQKLISSLLRTLNLFNLNKLRRNLSARQRAMTESTPDDLRKFTKDTVELVRRMEMQ